ncbi:MAG TPA: hypothetical protein VFM16_03925, partial [Holophagaceae bacterium]|nr:hypothetical protein [Holophagaceae bacterium]
MPPPLKDLPPDPLLEEEIRAELARDLLDQGRLSIPLVLLLLLVLARVLGRALFTDPAALAWYGALLGIVVLRWLHAQLSLQGLGPMTSPRTRMWSFAAGALAMGLG